MSFPNKYRSVCFRCGGIVPAGEGVCVKVDGEWAVRHTGRKCPENAERPTPPAPASETVLITGNTYPIREQLRAMGGRWDGAAKGWRVPKERADDARALVAAQPEKKPRSSGGGSYRRGGGRRYGGRYECEECGDYVRPGTRCWETGMTH